MPMTLEPIGIVHSPWLVPEGTPVQPYAAWLEEGGWQGGPEDDREEVFVSKQGGRGCLEIVPQWEEALADLDGLTHIWVYFWIHLSKPAVPKVLPYRDTVKRGLFSTRAPARPNPIGVSCVKLLSVRGRLVHVTGLDILDASPLLEIKPYIPEYDAFPEAKRGWLESPTVRQGAMHADNRFLKS